MPELPSVSEDFTADASGYLAALQEMIDATQDLITKVAELHAEIDSLPDVKNIEINITGDAIEVIETIKTELDSLEDRTLIVNVVYKTVDQPGGLADQTEVVKQVVVPAKQTGVEDVTENLNVAGAGGDQIKEMTNDLDELKNAAQEDSTSLEELSNRVQELGHQLGMTSEAISDDFNRSVEEMRASGYSEEEVLTEMSAGVDHLSQQMSASREAADGFAEGMDEVGAASRESVSQLDLTNLTLEKLYEQLSTGEITSAEAAHAMSAVSYSLQQMGASVEESGKDLDYFHGVLESSGGDAELYDKAISEGVPTMIAFAMGAKAAGESMGAALIPMSAASFGITGMATAIHLVVMGTFEFLAVFLPAMVAAGAAAAVMAEGVGQVKEKLTGVYESAEALGPMFNTTAGDMLGLGHSLQTAQTQADPAVYELLGAAINGVKAATGPATDGLSAFGQMGTTVLGILDKFAASMDIELGSSFGQIKGLVSGGVADLVEFGQILGNLGHAILNLAADMPGLAEIILKLIDGFSQLIKWVSDLPPGLIAVVMGIEEAYRWTGLLAGGFGLLGRAMALIGTLGIPVIAKIGMNFGSMAASMISGIAGLIGNFAALTTKIVEGAATMAASLGAEGMAAKFSETATAIDVGASDIVSGLSKAAEFMTGPWGAAIMLAVAAITILTIVMLRQKSATEEWIASQQQAVEAANNYQVLDQIANSMAGAQKLVEVNTAAATATLKEAGAGAREAQLGFGALGITYQQSSGAAKELTSYQQQLYGQSQNVIQGAMSISKAYGVSFAGALGLADAAQVKLVNGYTGSSHAAQVAQQQVANLVLAYQKMDQTGNTLSNSMQAIDVQAGIQASKVQQVNQAWDQFLSLSTGITGGFTQIQLDMQQMGNVAPVVGAKITAMTGATSQSVSQIAQSLKSFSGQSAQTWQSYNQSLQSAETFTDSLRTAAAAGAVTQTQYKEGIAGVVNELLPYAADSSAARAELSVLAQEAGYAGNDSFASLKAWIDKTGGSTVNMGGLIDNLTQKLSNVSSVAKTFAGTLQSDVLGAMAQAAVGTSGITKLTQDYTASLQANGAQAPQTKQAQDNLTTALQKEGFTATESSQLTAELSTAYANNETAADNTNTATNNMAGTLTGPARAAVDEVKAHTDDFTNALNQGLSPAIDTSGNKAKSNADGPMTDLNNIVKTLNTFVNDFTGAMKKWPASESTKVNVSGSGGTKISSSIPGAASGTINLSQLGLAGGGVLPGYAPGHDSIPAMLSPGEGVLIPQAVQAMGGKSAIDFMNSNAQHFAAGGIALPNVTGWAQGTLNGASKAITEGFQTEINDAIKYYKQQEALQSGPEGGATGSEMANGAELYQYLLKNVFNGSKIAAAGAIASIWGESSWNPFSVNCVPLTYKVVTKRGILSHWEVKAGDLTPVYDPETGRVGYSLIKGVPYHLDAQICRIGNLNWSVVCTWAHKWITEDGLVPAREMTPGTKILIGPGRWEAVDFAWDLGTEDTFCLTTSTGTWCAYRDEEVAADEGNEPGPFWTGNTDGRGLIGWTPAGTISNAAFSGGMATQEPAIIQFINSSGDMGVIREMESATSVSQAANEWGVGVERYGIDDVHAEGIALATSIMNSGGSAAPAQKAADAIARATRATQDAGGWIYPGMNIIDNKTGGVERTLGPNEGSSGQMMSHTVINIDGKTIMDAITPAMYKKGSRNNGNSNSNKYWAPGNR